MHIFGLGLHVIVALIFAVHALRNGQPMYWLFILFAFPLLGSLVYGVAVYLPSSGLQRQARRAVAAAGQALDPQREVREARAAFEDTPSGQNQMRLAAALLATGDAAESALQYQACLQGPFASDAEIRWGAAQAWFASGESARALELLQALREQLPDVRAEAVALLQGRALSALGRQAQARAVLEAAVAAHGSYEAKAELAIWALAQGERSLADALLPELDRLASRWNAHTRSLNAEVQRRLQVIRR